ncbi:MAG TPA: sulfur carrier protein ThiS [Candidatus Dormibacteraeota bacterium]|nr:sulfur carrier protein ThiS [Candidatus Dormibacteraeota bacterium]
MTTAILIRVNGENREIKNSTTVTQLLGELGLSSGRVAIEKNLAILPRAAWANTLVETGDNFEIVQFVGGG